MRGAETGCAGEPVPKGLRTQPGQPQGLSFQHCRAVSEQETGFLGIHRTAAGRVGALGR